MTKHTKTKKVAIVTYNRVGNGEFQNGVIERNGLKLYIAQNGHRCEWAAEPGVGTNSDRAEARARTAISVTQSINLRDMDKVYVYVGARGGEEAIRQTQTLEPTKVTYVMCDCNWGAKKEMIRTYGNSGAQVQECECGGQRTLGQIAREILIGQ